MDFCAIRHFSHAERKVQVAQKRETQGTKRLQRQGRKLRDSSGKLIFQDPILCAQFLRGYVDIPMLKDVQPGDIEDETERFVHLFTEERNSDVVKRIRLKEQKMPFYLISLIEHKSNVDYNVVMQIFRYMTFIWEDYEKEQERKQEGVSRTKGFRYPPVLPIVYYEGTGKWRAAIRLHERVLFGDMLGEYVPDYRCIMVQLNQYTNRMLMEKEDELSIVMMLNKLHGTEDFAVLKDEVPSSYLERVTADTPEYLLSFMGQLTEILLSRLNVPREEAERFADQVKERRMGELFANFKGYDVQETRRVARKEGITEGIERGRKEGKEEGIIQTIKHLKGTLETAAQELAVQCGMSEEEALETVRKYW